ncbi:MAG TPA: aldolase/citrate lyase family protein [Spirochaetota bacterium]|nr:aldolase/citrate lyase family protein [Spirochaetota bacterium]HNT09728.1 aldolase/citrate lyase family protein [Spirochaetota bacterium]
MDELRNSLMQLFADSGLVALKAGTEVEDMTFAEIAFLKELGDPILPLIVKIGGPEARNDIRACREIGVHGILAPMIESAYGLRNFVEATADIYRQEHRPYLAINIETVTAYAHLDEIMGSPWFDSIDQVTVGRSDLSASMDGAPDDDAVIAATRAIVHKASALGKNTSVGGKISPANAALVCERIAPSRINTRHMVYDPVRCGDLADAVARGLQFEEELCERLAEIEPTKRATYRERISATRARIATTPLPCCAAN